MFKHASDLVENLGRAPAPVERAELVDSGKVTAKTVARLFMLFHGWYGTLFTAKFATGERDELGKDRGIKSARMVWQSDLAEFDDETVMAAAARCKAEHPEFPPSLPQFVALCRAARPVKTWRPESDEASNLIGMSPELRAAHSKRVREEALARLRGIHPKDARDEEARRAPGLRGLMHAIADAVACAGGDEVAELRRLELMFARRAA